jgi:succinate dehydrogenase hydrophobic anchor subunit
MIKLHEVPPEPVDPASLPHDVNAHSPEGDGNPDKRKKIFGIPYPFSRSSCRRFLWNCKKISVLPMALYFPLHAANTLITPAVSPDSAPDDVLMMVREILPSITTKLLVAGITLHVSAGVLLRIVNNWNKPRRNRHRHLKISAEQDLSQDSIGLTGGISGYLFGLYKTFRIPPQVISGYILVPVLIYHLLIMKWVPNSISTEVDFASIKQLLSSKNRWWKWLGGLVPLAILLESGVYHIGSGLCRYFGVRKMTSRKKWSTAINLLTLVGFVSLIRLMKEDSTKLGPNQFESIFKKIRLLLHVN